ncbi:MAG: anti-sigma factor, partial [Planctomycetota bacterium]
MSDTLSPSAELPNDRLVELLADDAVFGLTADERHDLDSLSGEADAEREAEVFGRAAAAFYLASAPIETETLPPRVRDAVLSRCGPTAPTEEPADVAAAARATPKATPTDLLWPLAVAASLMIGVYLGGQSISGGSAGGGIAVEPADYAQQRVALLESGAPVTQVAWTPTDADAEIGGDVVWSPAEQRGFMTFSGLAVNDPAVEQYQLWIFDAER